MNSVLKLMLEIIPLLVFFVLYKQYNIIYATAGVILVTLVGQLITYYYEKKFSTVQLVATGLLAIFGSITIFSGDSTFIKLKPTIINIVFAVMLFGGTLRKKGLLKFVFGNAIKMSEKNWIIFSKRWALFFFLLAILNELVWRNFSEDFWVNFKVFGILGLTFLFLLTQMTFLHKNNISEPSE